jgi:outer membrane protein TolC
MTRPLITTLFLTLVVINQLPQDTTAQSNNDQPLSVETVLIYALANSPVVKDIDATLATRLADAVETRLHLNPQLSGGVGLPVQPAGDADRTQVGATLSQPLRVSDFGARQAVAELLTNAASVEQRLALLELSQNVSSSCAKIWILQEQRKFLQEQRARAETTRQQLERAKSRGAIGGAEIGLFSAEFKKLTAQLLGVDADLGREQAILLRNSTLNAAGKTLSSPEKTLSAPLESILQGVRDRRLPIQARYELLHKIAAERAHLARQDAFPIISPQLTYQRTEDGGVFVGGGLQFDLPIFNRNQPDIARREGEAIAARARHEYYQGASFQQEIELMVESVHALRRQADTFENDIVPTLRSALKKYDEQFLAGTGTALTLWQTQRELSSAQQTTLELWMRFFVMRSELSILVGQHL